MSLDVEVKQLLNKYSADDVRTAISKVIYNKDNEKLLREVKKHENLVGKCFKYKYQPPHFKEKIWRYCKVISARAESEFRVQCLVFDERPLYWFSYKANNKFHISPGDWFLGRFDFDSFVVEEVMTQELKYYTPIEESVYANAAFQYLCDTLKLQWVEDHTRLCNILPEQEGWDKNE